MTVADEAMGTLTPTLRRVVPDPGSTQTFGIWSHLILSEVPKMKLDWRNLDGTV